MEKKYARLAALLAAAVLCGNGAPSMAAWWEGTGAETITITADNYSQIQGDVYGNHDTIDTTNTVTGRVEMTGGTVTGNVHGGYSSSKSKVSGSTVAITGGSIVEKSVYGGWGNTDATYNTVTITGGEVGRNVYGGCSDTGVATGNTVTITSGKVSTVGKGDSGVYGGWGDTDATCNTVTITSGSTVESRVCGGYSLSHSGAGEVLGNTVTITGGSTVKKSVYGGYSLSYHGGEVSDNTVTITSGKVGTKDSGVYGGFINGDGEVSGNTVTITGGTVGGDVYGGYSDKGAATGNTVTITGGTVGTEDSSSSVYGGYSWSDSNEVSGNTVALLGSADVTAASLYGRNDDSIGSRNTLLIDGWSGSTQSVKNFDEVTFRNIRWKTGGTVLDITHNSRKDALKDTAIHQDSISFAGGTELQTNASMTFIEGDNLGIQKGNVDVADTFTAGVAAVGTGEMSVGGDGNTLSYKITGVFRNRQTDTVAENRLAGAAFVNQGADIAADSLRLLDDGYHYGTQTFGAVYGNRSQYDVASDIKINGWSEIAGFGNIHEVKGGRLAWGVFYENGTGNYRTWNTFNNEMFRGDGSLLYNGGGAAIRLTKDSGMYYEASFRAGTLSSSMTNAVRDGYGNSYGFDSDSTYWGGHIGAGKLIQRGSGQWAIYGKYFHTDIDGDSFEMGGDRFSFDSVTSDRLRLGARYTADTDKAWSLYCGAAYEYEFSGDSHMKAGQFEAPEQSLQGSTVFGEIGTVWGRKDSPWSMDINLRGYAGEREGFSGMVQLAYAF